MRLMHASKREEIAVGCSQNDWKQVLQSCEHAKECGWEAFMAQRAQEAHEQWHLQIAAQTATDHFVRVLSDQEYRGEISYQERNNNLLLSETIKLIKQMKTCVIVSGCTICRWACLIYHTSTTRT